jgi:hypothetical protein
MIPQRYATLVPVFIAGCVVIVLQLAFGTLAMALAPSPEWLIAGVVVGFLLGVPLGIGVTRPLPALTFPAMGLFALTSVAPAFVINVPLWGGVAELRQGDAIVTGAAGYIAPGWRIDAQRTTQERLSAGRGNRGYGHRHMAPLIAQGWTPRQPVVVWVAGETRDSGRVLAWHPKFWSESGGEFVRMAGKDLSGAQLAAGRAAEKYKLITAQEPLIVMRVPSVAGAIADQYWALARAARWPFGAWLLLIAIAAAVIEWRHHR